MIQLRTYHFIDQEVFGREAFSLLMPSSWGFSGGIWWRQHPTMPAAANFTLSSPDGCDELKILPSLPYTDIRTGIMAFSLPQGSNYMGNEVRKTPQGFVQYLRDYYLPRYMPGKRIVDIKNSPELAEAVMVENLNSGVPRSAMQVDAGIVRLEYCVGGRIFQENLSCALLAIQLMPGHSIWIADKMVAARTLKGRLDDYERLFMTILKSFKLDIYWLKMYGQLVQQLINGKMREIRNTAVISRIVHNTYNEISDMNLRAYEERQAVYDHIYQLSSESIRGVNSYHDPFKGYEVEFPVDYDYVYANALGDYILTDNPNDNPNLGSNHNWTLLDQVK